MRSLLILTAMMFAATSTSSLVAGEAILDHLKLGSTSPDELEQLFPGTRTEIPNGDGQRIVHFKDANGNSGVCRFVHNRLFKYTVALRKTSPDIAAAGGWDKIIEKGIATLGTPKRKSNDVVAWDLKDIQFILSRKAPKCITVAVSSKQLETLARKEATALPAPPRITGKRIHGGPYYFTGFHSETTRTVKLTRGIYRIRSVHKGSGNFIVSMYSSYDEDLVANEIGHSSELRVIRVQKPVIEVFFAVEDCGGFWEIHANKVPVTP